MASAQHLSQSSNPTQDQRRLRLLQRRGFFTDKTHGAKTFRATNADDLRMAYGVVHDRFVESGFIKPTPSGLRVRAWETDPNTATFISKSGDEVVGVFSIVSDSDDLKLPSDNAFESELDDLRSQGRVLCELTSQAIAKEFRNSSITTELMRCIFAQGWHNEATDLVCSISPGLVKFYEFIGFKQLGEVKSYSDTIDDPVALMVLEDFQSRWLHEDLDSGSMEAYWKRYFIAENPYMNAIPVWNTMAEYTFNDPDAIQYLFAGCANLFDNASPTQFAGIEQRLGNSFDDIYYQSPSFNMGWV